MIIELDRCRLRPMRQSDAHSFARYANNYNVWVNLTDRFPHPYTVRDARKFISVSNMNTPQTYFGVEYEGEIIGAAGVSPKENVWRTTAELGYWLGEPFWGRGLMTDIVTAITAYGFKSFDIKRIEALVFDYNVGSLRVLEKAGYQQDAYMRQCAVKNGEIINAYMYSCLREEYVSAATEEAGKLQQAG